MKIEGMVVFFITEGIKEMEDLEKTTHDHFSD
jgi:hypothetical protein